MTKAEIYSYLNERGNTLQAFYELVELTQTSVESNPALADNPDKLSAEKESMWGSVFSATHTLHPLQRPEAPLAMGIQDLPRYYAILTGEGLGTTPAQHLAWLERNQRFFVSVFRQMASHSGRFTGFSNNCNLVAEGAYDPELPYLCSTSIPPAERTGVVPMVSAGLSPVARYLGTRIRLNGVETSLMQAASAGDDWPLEIGIPLAMYNDLKAATTVPPDRDIAKAKQLLWPVGGDYEALIPIPSVDVIGALVRALAPDQLKEQGLIGVPRVWFPITNSNPQNLGPFNAAIGGSCPIFRGYIPKDRHEVVPSRAWTWSWLNALKDSDKKSLLADHPAWSSRLRSQYVANNVHSALGTVLRFVEKMHGYVQEESLPLGLCKKLSGYAPYEYLRNPSKETGTLLTGEILAHLVRQDKKLAANVDRQALLREIILKELCQ